MNQRTILLIPANELRPRQPDGQFAPLREVAATLDVEIALVDHSLLDKGRADEAIKASWANGVIVYRGWMLRSEHYSTFELALASINTTLFTTAEEYRRAHELPGWYDIFAGLTPSSRWLTDASLDGLERFAADFDGPVVIKDWVKSAKHAWNDACFVPSANDTTALRRVCERFLAIRDAQLVGGVVVREFEHFVGPEVRTWWLNGEHVLTTPHPDAPTTSVPSLDLTDVRTAVRRLGCRFVSVDVVHRRDGALRVIEVGDGQVSDLPDGTDAATVLGPVLAAAQRS